MSWGSMASLENFLHAPLFQTLLSDPLQKHTKHDENKNKVLKTGHITRGKTLPQLFDQHFQGTLFSQGIQPQPHQLIFTLIFKSTKRVLHRTYKRISVSFNKFVERYSRFHQSWYIGLGWVQNLPIQYGLGWVGFCFGHDGFS